MDAKQFEDLDELLIQIFDAAQIDSDKLRGERESLRRAGHAIVDFSQHVAEQRAFRHAAFAKILSHLSTVDSEYLPRFAALYFFRYADAKGDANKFKRLWKKQSGDLSASYKKLTIERKRRLLTKEENVFLVDFKNKSDSARRKGSDAIHAENRSMKADVFVWLDVNMPNFKSMDAAAQAVTKQQPIAFRTARDWIGEWKKLRSTGKP